MPATILIVDDNPLELSAVVAALTRSNYLVAAANSFRDALRQLLTDSPPDLLVTRVRLGAYNGLQLVLRGRAHHPRLAAIVLGGFADDAFEREAKRHGAAAYLSAPLDLDQLLTTVRGLLGRDVRQRRWPRKELLVGMTAALDGAPATVVNVSYGGLCVEQPRDADRESGPVQVTLPAFGVVLNAELVWTGAESPAGASRCGAALTEPVPSGWRKLVDVLPGEMEAALGR